MKIFNALHNIGAWIAFHPSFTLGIIFIVCLLAYEIATNWSN